MLTLLISSNALSDVVVLDKGTPAPFAGYLLDTETGKLSRVRLIEGEEAKALNLSYVRKIGEYQANEILYTEQVKTVLEQNDKLSKSLRDSQSMTTWERIGWFTLGIVAVSAGAYGISRVK